MWGKLMIAHPKVVYVAGHAFEQCSDSRRISRFVSEEIKRKEVGSLVLSAEKLDLYH